MAALHPRVLVALLLALLAVAGSAAPTAGAPAGPASAAADSPDRATASGAGTVDSPDGAPPALPAASENDTDGPLVSGRTYCRGDRLRFRGDPGATYEVREADGGPVVAQVEAGPNGTGVVETAGLNGSYVLHDPAGDPVYLDERGRPGLGGPEVAYDWQVEPAVAARVEPNQVRGDEWPAEAELRVRFCAGGPRPVEIESPLLAESELARLFNGTTTGDGVRVAVPADGRVPIRVPYALAGVHALRVRPANGTDGTRAVLRVLVSEAPTAAFARSAVQVEPGGVAEFDLYVRHVETARLDVEATNGSLAADVRVADADGDGRVTVRVDVGPVGPEGFGGRVRAAGADETVVRSATWNESRGGFSAGRYRLTASVGGRETDVAALVVGETNATADASTTTGDATATTDSRTTGPTASGTADGARTTGPGQSGFGPVAALVGLAALAFVRWR